MNDWRSKTGKHAERVRQEAERAKQASLEAYRKALKSIRTRAPELRAKLPSNREGWVRAGLIAVAVLICLVLAGGVVEGGSTITQQLARNMFLTQRRLISRKLAEMMLALEIERRLTKDEIVERYLNQVYFGNGAYGVEMAARVYFGKSAGNLNLAESAMLARIIRSPSTATPFQNVELAKGRQRTVLRRMADLGYITPQQAQGAAAAAN